MNQPKEFKMKAMFLTTALTALLFLGIPISCQKDDVNEIIVYGKVIDQDSKEGIANMKVKVEGVAQFGIGRRTESGNTYTNADGTFNVAIKSTENAAFYEFFANRGSSNQYTEGTDYHGGPYLDSIARNKIPMVFELAKIEPLRINLKNTSPINEDDYVSLYFYSDSMGFLRVNTVENFGSENLKYVSPAPEDSTRTEWVGANVNSIIHGNILVNEELAIIVTTRKNGVLTEVTKLINGKRNTINEINIEY